MKPLAGVGIRWRRPSSTTLPANHDSSRRLPRMRSLPIEVIWYRGIEGDELGVLAPLAERQPGQRIETGKRHHQKEFFPHRDHDVRAQQAFEPGGLAEIAQA